MADPLTERLLLPSEVAALWRVDVKTVNRWAQSAQRYGLTILRTPSGHRRFRESEMRNLMAGRNPDGTSRANPIPLVGNPGRERW